MKIYTCELIYTLMWVYTYKAVRRVTKTLSNKWLLLLIFYLSDSMPAIWWGKTALKYEVEIFNILEIK